MEILEIIDLRDNLPSDALDLLKKKLGKKSNSDGLWFVTDYEPIECYHLLMKEEYLFQTFIIADNEFRVFVGARCYWYRFSKDY